MPDDENSTLRPPPVPDLAGLHQRLEDRLFGTERLPAGEADAPTLVADRYELGDPIGRGSAAVVWRAHDRVSDRPCALKILHAGEAQGGTATDRLLREARLATQLRHPHIVSVLDCGIDPVHGAYVAMERIDAEPLAVVMDGAGRLPWSTARRILTQVADALAHAHDRGIVHRDVTPGNILVARSEAGDHCFIVDFGLARRVTLDPASRELTASGAVLGTPRYISPEQARARPTDGRADQYALGCIAYEMLAGVPAAPGQSVGEVLLQHLRIEPLPFHDVDPGIAAPPGVEAVVRRALRKAPAERFASMAAFRDALLALDA